MNAVQIKAGPRNARFSKDILWQLTIKASFAEHH